MAFITDPDELPLPLTWSLRFGNPVDTPISSYQRCLNFCIRAFGAGVKKGDKVQYLGSDPRFFVPTELSSFCEVATLNNEVGVLLVIRPIDGEREKSPEAFLERCKRLSRKHPEYLMYATEKAPLQAFIPIGQIAIDGEPIFDSRADKQHIQKLYSDFLSLLDTGAMPIAPEKAIALRVAIQMLDSAIVAEDEFCF